MLETKLGCPPQTANVAPAARFRWETAIMFPMNGSNASPLVCLVVYSYKSQLVVHSKLFTSMATGNNASDDAVPSFWFVASSEVAELLISTKSMPIKSV
jgi:hypothetical protein